MENSKPIQYQKGYVEFYKLRFKVTPDVLIPRPETELLVDEALHSIKSQSASWRTSIKEKEIIVLDIGTGAGNIAISIAKNLPKPINASGMLVKIIAIDISQKALEIAKQNAKLHGVEKYITFIKSNLLSSKQIVPLILNTIPLILVTNLPYIPTQRIPYLDPSVKDFEPKIALDGGPNGFSLYRKLFQQLKHFELPPRRWKLKLIIGEIDYTHGELAKNEALKYFPEAEVEIKTDLAKKQRILIIKR